MDIRFTNAASGPWSADCVLSFSFEKESPSSYSPSLWEAAPWLEISPALRDFTGKKHELVLLYGHPEAPLSRVLLCGLGKKEDFSMNIFRNTVAKAVQLCRDKNFGTLGMAAESLEKIAHASGKGDHETFMREVAASALLALYKNDTYRSGKKDGNDETPADPRWLAFLFTGQDIPDALHRAARRGEAEASGVIMAQDLSNGPANHITPVVLADEAHKLAKAHGFRCTIYDEAQIKNIGMGALYAVGQGARHAPRFIILEHCPTGKEQDSPLVVVGKGITFDTGGISLKPAAKMHEMKGDMGGAAAVMGFFAAIGGYADADELPRTIGLIPTAENMPGGNATRPGDVVTTLSGQTVEILNTDAEGRLVLCDALSYAQQEWTPCALIDLATLTGACVVALGDYGTGLFTDDDGLRQAILDKAEDTGDLVWPLPLWNDYDANLKSDVADMANIGPREGGAIHAGLFLRRFINKGTRWAHLDIAGPGYVVKPSPLHPVAGGTGVGVRLLCRLLRDKQTCSAKQ